MEKKLIKAILDVIKDVKDRPSVYGIQFHKRSTGEPVVYFTDGYVAIKLFCGEYEGLRPINEDMWVSGTQLQGIYKDMKAKDVYLNFHNDTIEHIDLENFWITWHKDLEETDGTAIDANVFKKLAPFGNLYMTLNKHKDSSSELILFSGKGVQAVACPLNKKVKEELCRYQ